MTEIVRTGTAVITGVMTGAGKLADEVLDDVRKEGISPQLKRVVSEVADCTRMFGAAVGLPGLDLADSDTTLGDRIRDLRIVVPTLLSRPKPGEPQDLSYTPCDKPRPQFPDAHGQPPATMFDGKCGFACISNMMRLYETEINPKDIDRWYRRSFGPGMRADALAVNLTELSGMRFSKHAIKDGSDPLVILRKHIDEGKPVAIQYTPHDWSKAHWLSVVAINEGKDGPELTVQSWGHYHKVKWTELKDYWRQGFEGPYPYVVADKPSPFMEKMK